MYEFFLCSIPKVNGELIENTEDLPSECGDYECSLLPAMKPIIMYRYPQEELEELIIDNLKASLCFPNGIKVCYKDSCETKKRVNNFKIFSTNQFSNYFYGATYHFYLKMKNSEYSNKYKLTSMKHKLDNKNETDKSKIKTYQNLDKKDYVYIPYCACLFSRYPFYEQMEKC